MPFLQLALLGREGGGGGGGRGGGRRSGEREGDGLVGKRGRRWPEKE